MGGIKKDIYWTQFGFDKILTALKAGKRIYLPDHTEDSETDLVNAMLYLMAHIDNRAFSREDVIAACQYPISAPHRSAMLGLANFLGRPLSPPVPSTVDLLMDLTQDISASTTLVDKYAKFSTIGSADAPEIPFEYLDDALVSDVNDVGGSSNMVVEEAGVFSAYAGSGLIFATPDVDDCLYIGHRHLMFTGVALDLSVAAAGLTFNIEYPDAIFAPEPNSLTDSGTAYKVIVDSLVLQGTNRADTDALVLRVSYLPSGAYEDCEVKWDGSNHYVDTSDYLGEASADLTPAKFQLTADWITLPSVTDGTSNLTVDGEITWDLPYDEDRRWEKTTINGIEAYWIRIRVSIDALAANPNLNSVAESAACTWHIGITVTQGKTVSDTVGTTTTEANQEYQLTYDGYISDSIQKVKIGTDDTWEEVDSFLNSLSTDKHYLIRERTSGTFWIRFGNGTKGTIPTSGLDIVMTYRIGAENDGNTGANTITAMKTGTYYLGPPTNPEGASGWQDAEGSDSTSLDELRIEIPASVRALERVVTPDDAVTLSKRYTTSAGAKPVARALATEVSVDKSIRLVVVGNGGSYISASILSDMETYFNGELIGLQRIGGIMMHNSLLYAHNYIKKTINVTYSMDIREEYYANAEGLILSALRLLLSPLAYESDGTYKWRLGGVVTPWQIAYAIIGATPGIESFTLSAPAADTNLAGDELPWVGTVSATINPV